MTKSKLQQEKDQELLGKAAQDIHNAGILRMQKYWNQTKVKHLLAAQEREVRREMEEKVQEILVQGRGAEDIPDGRSLARLQEKVTKLLDKPNE